MAQVLSPDEALAEARGYTGMNLTTDDLQSLYAILTMPRKDTAIASHLRKAGHQLGGLPHLPEGENWWDKVHEDMLAASDGTYIEEQPGTRKSPVPHDRNAVIFWLEHKILPAVVGQAAASAPSLGPETVVQSQSDEPVALASGKQGLSGQGPLADAKKRRALEQYAMDAATAYYQARGWDVEHVSDTKKVLDLRLVNPGSGEVRRVEVKGSAQAASHVEVTKAEVAMSRQEPCYLFVLDKIHYEATGPGPDDYNCWGGRRRAGNWCADDKDLEAKTFDYHFATDFGKAGPP